MSRFTVEQTQVAGLQLIQRKPMGDERGYLERLFCTSDLEPLGVPLSHGCVRMNLHDVIELYSRVTVGTPVVIVA